MGESFREKKCCKAAAGRATLPVVEATEAVWGHLPHTIASAATSERRKHVRKNAMWLLTGLTAALVAGVTGSVVVTADGPESERPRPSAAGDLPVVVSGQGEVRRVYGLDGREGFEVRLPAVHVRNPVSEVTLIKDGVPLTFRTRLLDPAPGQFGKSAPRDLSCTGSNPGYCVCHSEAYSGASYFRSSMEL